jgi:hypothetical protein
LGLPGSLHEEWPGVEVEPEAVVEVEPEAVVEVEPVEFPVASGALMEPHAAATVRPRASKASGERMR